MKWRREVSLMMTAVIMGGLLAGCGGSGDAEGSSQNGGENGKEPVKLTFKTLTWIKAEQEAQKAVIDEWNAAHPDIQVELQSADWATATNELLTAFETGDVPDIFQYAQPIIADWKDLGYLDDMSVMLTEEDKADVNADIWSGLTASDGSIVGIPIQYEVDVTFYNKEIFEKYNITPPTMEDPWTFDEMVEVARMIQEKEGIQGMSFPGPDHFGRVFTEVWAPKIGDPLVYAKEDGSYEVKLNDESREFFKKIKALFDEGLISQSMLSTDANTIALNEFMGGKSGMLVGYGCWYRSQFINETEGMDAIDWGVAAPIAVNSTSVYGYIQTLSVPKDSKHKEEAYEFLKWYWNKENTLKIAKAAYIMPGRNSAIQDESLNTSEYAWDLCQQAVQKNVLPEYVKLPGWGQFTEGVALTLCSEYFTGTIDFDDFVSRFESEGTRILNENR